MFWKKRKEMIDIRELRKRAGVIAPVSSRTPIISSPPTSSTTNTEPAGSTGEFLSFMDNSIPSDSLSAAGESDIRKVSLQISELDNKLYKLEQRIELIERKLGVI